MSLKLTEAQQMAIDSDGNILVAAAAGSGKTAVLVERVINKLCSKTNPVSADRLLIVTFTNAAAAEMRGRIERRLDEEYRKNPQDAGIMMQKYLLSSAKICTIDSFCIDLVRENFEKVGVSPDFTLSDEKGISLVNESVISSILNSYLQSKDPVFMELADIIGTEFDEKNLTEFIIKLYNYSRQLSFPKEWFNSFSHFYGDGEFEKDNVWRKFVFNRTEELLLSIQKSLVKAIDLTFSNETATEMHLPIFSYLADITEKIGFGQSNSDWDEIYNIVEKINIPKLPNKKSIDEITDIAAAKTIYKDIVVKNFETIKKLFYADENFINSQFAKLYKPVKLLSEILIEFDKKAFEACREANVFTFHHIEHLVLNMLCEKVDGEIVVKQGAEEFLDRFDEVCVDEYQDTNDLQNMLFYVLSNLETKLFAVGDVKQSIYGFRGANPKHFMDKKNNHISAKIAKENDPKKIILSNNFRCKKEVCDFANYFFGLFMTKNTGDIVYDEEERLVSSAVFPETKYPAVTMDIIDTSGDEEKNKVAEARAIAVFIKKNIEKGDIIRVDENTLRQAKYSDFTILLRSLKNNAAIFADELKKQGIPVSYNADEFLEYTEIKVLISLLKVIDNPSSEIELLTVMMSPIFNFTAEEIALMKAGRDRKESFYASVIAAKDNGDLKAKYLIETLQKFRTFAVTNTIPKLLRILLDETDFSDIVSAYSFGSRRRNNILLLSEYAEEYSANGNSSISGFVDFIVKQSEKSIKSAVGDSGEDTVKIMSIHGSKGLQFPICIVAMTSAGFNNNETKENNIYSTDFGIGFKYFDEADKKKYTTLGREAILEKLKIGRLAEELRLLYVAMTRTQDILHFTATVSKTEEKLQKYASLLFANDCEITNEFWQKSNSYFEWLVSALLLHPDCKELRENYSSLICKETNSRISVNLINSIDLPICEESTVKENISYNDKVYREVKENLYFEYPFSKLSQIESKVSVSAVANRAESEKYSFTAKPAFMSIGGITASEKGTAMHKVMEFFDFQNWQEPESEIERLCEWQFLSEREMASVNISAIKNFFESTVFKRILNAKTVKREMRFLTELPAKAIDSELSEDLSEETIIFQGAVDVCFEEDDGIVILDFKTDRTDDANDLKNVYSEQLNIYSMACEKIFGKPVKSKIIYSFFLSREIEV